MRQTKHAIILKDAPDCYKVYTYNFVDKICAKEIICDKIHFLQETLRAYHYANFSKLEPALRYLGNFNNCTCVLLVNRYLYETTNELIREEMSNLFIQEIMLFNENDEKELFSDAPCSEKTPEIS